MKPNTETDKSKADRAMMSPLVSSGVAFITSQLSKELDLDSNTCYRLIKILEREGRITALNRIENNVVQYTRARVPEESYIRKPWRIRSNEELGIGEYRT